MLKILFGKSVNWKIAISEPLITKFSIFSPFATPPGICLLTGRSCGGTLVVLIHVRVVKEQRKRMDKNGTNDEIIKVDNDL
jgi:hypothetical protein